MKAGEPPLVLIFDEGGVGPLDDEGDEFVFPARADDGSEIELGGEAGVFGEADGDAVDVNGEDAGGAAEVDDDALVGPRGGDGERAAVNAGGVGGRNAGSLLLERHFDVRVVGLAVALELEAAGNLEGAPSG